MKTSGIYKITNYANGKIYIGSPSHIESRWSDHFKTLRRNCHKNTHLQRAWNKYGEECFIFEIIELVEKSNLLVREQYWIDTLNVCDGEVGYNIARKAQSVIGVKRSAETRAKMSAWQIGRKLPEETRIKIGKGHKGKKLTASQIEVIRKNSTGRKHSDETKAKISAGNKGKVISQASRLKMSRRRLEYFQNRDNSSRS